MSTDALIEKLSKRVDVHLQYSYGDTLVGRKKQPNSSRLDSLAKKIRKELKETRLDSVQSNHL